MKLVFATKNHGKLAELTRLLTKLGVGDRVELVTAADVALPDVEETGKTFAENAALKAEAAAAVTGLWALADDSGLEVDALDGRPGVRSARYGGEHVKSDAERYTRLLQELEGVVDDERTARFRCAIALAIPGQPVRHFAGHCEGSILHAPIGEGGFGYDPVFFSHDLKLSFGLAEAEQKNAISHRGRAMRQCAAALKELLS